MAMVLIRMAIVIQQINYPHQYTNQRGLDDMLNYLAGQFRHFARSEEFCMRVIELWTGEMVFWVRGEESTNWPSASWAMARRTFAISRPVFFTVDVCGRVWPVQTVPGKQKKLFQSVHAAKKGVLRVRASPRQKAARKIASILAANDGVIWWSLSRLTSGGVINRERVRLKNAGIYRWLTAATVHTKKDGEAFSCIYAWIAAIIRNHHFPPHYPSIIPSLTNILVTGSEYYQIQRGYCPLHSQGLANRCLYG